MSKLRVSKIFHNVTFLLIIDHNGFKDHYFVIAGKAVKGEEDNKPMLTRMTSPGFVGKEQKHECLTFWFFLEVCLIPLNFIVLAFAKRSCRHHCLNGI